MEIQEFDVQKHFHACLGLFDSNCPKYFLPEERDEFIQWMQQDKEPFWVGKVEDIVVACGGIYKAEENTKSPAEFSNEVGFAWGMVDEKHHKQGFGKVLSEFRMNYLIAHYPERPIVLRTSQRTFGFYEKLGFTQISYTKDGWGKGLDKVVMVYQAKEG